MKRKQHMFLIVTTYILIIFLSSYFIIMPNINKIKEINNTKDLTYEEKSKLIDEVNKKYIVLELEVSDKYSALSSATKDKYNPLIEEVKQINYRDITKRNNRSKCVRYILLGGIIILFPLIYIIVIYNRLTKLYNKVKESWSEVNIHLKERSDLIPNVVKTVKGYKNYEKDALIGIINARSEVLKAENKDEIIRANEKLDNAISKLLVTIESYPELKSNENFMSLQDNLVDIENKISVSRSKYNKSVLNYKNKLEVFPSNIIASIFNFKQELFFEIEKEDKENPKTKF